MSGGMRRRGAVGLAAAVLALVFGAGFLTARTLPPGGTAPPAAGAPPAGFTWPFFGKIRAAGAPRPAGIKPAGFTVWRTRLDTRGPDPLACIQMTRTLDPQRSYGDYVLVAPALDHPPSVTARGDELCIGGVGFYGRRITLLKGLTAKTGEALAANVDADFVPGDKPPSVAFQGEGVILPRSEADGLGLETVNVSRLALEVWRVPDRNLVRKSITAPDPTADGERSYEYGEDSGDDSGRVVWRGDLPVHGAAGQRTVTVFPLGAVLKDMKPGAYVVKARDASVVSAAKKKDGETDPPPVAQARRWILFTDMALSAYDGSDSLDVVVRSLKTARTLQGVRVALVAKDGEDLAAAQSDGQGRVRFDHALMKGEDAAKARMVMAYGPQADFTALDLERAPVDLSSKGVGGRVDPARDTNGRTVGAAVDGWLYADRGVYRPGETVHLVALLRDRQARAVRDRPGALVIRRPSGVEFQRIRFGTTPGGSLAQEIALSKAAPRGKWKATLELDGADDGGANPAGEVQFGVEDFAPQRLAVTVSGDGARPVAAGETRRIDVAARFLYGATGSGLQTQAEARIRADADPFPAYKDYRWGDERTTFQEKLVQLPQTVTDGAGHATEPLDTSGVADVVQPLAAAFSASVFEPGGRPVKEAMELKLRPRPVYLGVKPVLSGAGEAQTASFEMIAVDPQGRRITVPGVSYTLISENWKYDWFEKDGRWQWRRSSHDAPIAASTITLAAGIPARFTKRLAWGDYRLEMSDAKSGARTVVKLASGWGDTASDVEAPDSARVTAGTQVHRQGDVVEVTLQAPYAGEAQVAVATDRLIDFKTLSVPEKGATVRFKSSAAWGGGAYVLVSVIQPRDPAATPKPRRALGLVYVPLEPRGRTLAVDLTAPAKLDSRQPVDVPITVHGLPFGGRAHVTLAAVDEGILRLTHQENPDPVKWYFGKRALSLSYRDDYGRLLDPNLGAATAVKFGADEIGGAGLTTTPIKTVALWSGVVETDLGGHAHIRLPASPDFDGQLRLMAVAWTDDAVGSGVSDVIVREPVVAELSLPRFLSPGDEALATLELHNVEGRVGAYVAELFGRNGLLAPFRRLYQLVLGQRIVERTPVNAPAAAGVGRVDLHVSGPGFDTTKSYPLQTRLGWGDVARVSIDPQNPGEAFTPSPQLLGGLSAGTLSMTVSYSPFRGFDPAPIAEALSRYPYGCTEQIVSAAYPLLYATEVSATQAGGKPGVRHIPTALVEAVSKVLDREALDGSFGLWKAGDGEADPWLGAYAVDFLLRAKAQGVAVPDDGLERALRAMRLVSKPDGFVSVGYRMSYDGEWFKDPAKAAVQTAHLRSRAATYALYVLAEAGQGDLPRLRWFHDTQMKDEPSPLARAQVGAGLALMGDRARAHDSLLQAGRALGFKEDEDWYQTPLRDVAGVVALAYEAGDGGVARGLQGRLENSVRDPDALSTQEQARLLQAAHAMLAAAGPIRIEARGVHPLGPNRWAVGRLADARFVNAGPGVLWRTVTVHGVPSSAPGASASGGLSLDKRLFTLDGGTVDPGALKQGDRVVVRLAGGSAQARSALTVLDDALPAGWEVETTLSPDDAKTGPFKFLGELSAASVQEKRDDRFIAALTVHGTKPFALAYIARAVTPGSYFLPGAEARDMYRPSVRARTAPGRLTIAPAG